MDQTKISVIITVEKRLESLPALLSCFERQTLPAAFYEIILVFYGSSSGEDLEKVEHIAAGAPMRTLCLREASANEVAAKNIGAFKATSPLLLFLDQDLLAGAGLLATHVKQHEKEGVKSIVMGAVEAGGALHPGKLTRWFMKHDKDLMNAAKPDAPFSFSSRHCSLPRDSFLSIDGFDENYTASRAADIALVQRLKKGRLGGSSLPGTHAFIWREARFIDERRRFRSEGYDICRLSLMQKNPEMMHHFFLNYSRLRLSIDSFFIPFYVRACQEAPLDIRAHGLSCQRVFLHDLRCGARAVITGQALNWDDIEEQEEGTRTEVQSG